MEPLTITELRDATGALDGSHDLRLERLGKSARQWFEERTGRRLLTSTVVHYLTKFPAGSCIKLPAVPLIAVTEIRYTDSAGDPQTVASSDYTIRTDREPAEIHLTVNASWPTDLLQQTGVIEIEATYGYGATRSTLPPQIVEGLLAYVCDRFANPESPAADFSPLLNQWRIPEFSTDGMYP